ncbi:MAG: glycosyltransferase family 2 protein [Candidatus Aureabacteria bacterium]|nr:glycosyltransferase family 2 protein [Candidatus Auribacterota bacterium]
MKIAIIFVTYNRKDYAQKTIEHHEKQIGGDDRFNIYIYDNGSNDGTAEYLKSYKGKLNINVTFGEKNIGMADGLKYLLKEKCFGKGFDFITKTDDDLLPPDGWHEIMDYWDEIEKRDIAFAGFRVEDCNEFFEGFKWVATNPENMTMIPLGKFECYRSYMVNGVQIAKEKSWQKVFPYITDLEFLYGGWDYTLLFGLKKFKKWCMVAYNFKVVHLQNDTDYKEFTRFKNERIKLFQEKYDMIEDKAVSYWNNIIRQLRESYRKNPKDINVLRSLIKAYDLKGNDKLKEFYRKKLEKILRE